MLQYATNGYIVGPSEDYTHTILKLNHVTHIDSHAQAICSALNLYRENIPYQLIIIII